MAHDVVGESLSGETGVVLGGMNSRDAVRGAIIGALIGDAMGMGCHWYSDAKNMRKDYGGWITGYVDQKPERSDTFGYVARYRHGLGLKAGDISQTGESVVLLLESVAKQGTYDEGDFTSRLDGLLSSLDGTPLSGRFTDWAIRDVTANRRAGKSWDEAAGRADTGEAAIRAVVLASRFFQDTERLVEEAYRNVLVTHSEPYVASQSLAYTLAVAAFINGTSIRDIRAHMQGLSDTRLVRELIPSYDILTQVANGAVSSTVDLDPHSVYKMSGTSCTLGFMLPTAYYFFHRYAADFELAMLNAVNGGGNNMAVAALVGGLSGALNGFSSIPERFVTGLADNERLVGLADKVARDAIS